MPATSKGFVPLNSFTLDSFSANSASLGFNLDKVFLPHSFQFENDSCNVGWPYGYNLGSRRVDMPMKYEDISRFARENGDVTGWAKDGTLTLSRNGNVDTVNLGNKTLYDLAGQAIPIPEGSLKSSFSVRNEIRTLPAPGFTLTCHSTAPNIQILRHS